MTLSRPLPKSDVGVIIGRFQIHALHELHRELIDSVRQHHDRTIILLGVAPLRCNMRNPLDFPTRQRMIWETFPHMEVYPIADCRDDADWSRTVDLEISRWLKPHQTVTLYGGRDSFIPYYTGQYPTCELESESRIASTEIRNRIANQYDQNADYRAGVIAAAFDHFPTSYTVVDVAVLDLVKDNLLLGRKPREREWRFLGGFCEPTSDSLEHDARREVQEEAGVQIGYPRYVGSLRIDDWRYRFEVDKVLSAFFVASFISGAPRAGDDIEEVRWVALNDVFNGHIPVVREHIPFVRLLANYLKRSPHAYAYAERTAV